MLWTCWSGNYALGQLCSGLAGLAVAAAAALRLGTSTSWATFPLPWPSRPGIKLDTFTRRPPCQVRLLAKDALSGPTMINDRGAPGSGPCHMLEVFWQSPGRHG